MLPRLLILQADFVEQFRVQHQFLVHRHRPGTRVGFRIVDRERHFERAESWAAQSFGHGRATGHRSAKHVDPQIVPEAVRVDDERVSIPYGARIAVPRRIRIDGQWAPVNEDLAVHGVHFVQQHQEARSVYKLGEVRHDPGPRWIVG